MSSPFNYMPSKDEEKALIPYTLTVIVGCNDGTGISRQYLFPVVTLLWLYQERLPIPLDVSFSLQGPQSFHLVRILNMLEQEKTLVRVCVACGQYTIKPAGTVPASRYYPKLTVIAARMYGKVKSLCQGGQQWTTNVLCGVFSKGGGMDLVIKKQKEFAKVELTPETIRDIINRLYSPIIGRVLVL